ncbi:malto-oligosyltrehalose trehalohydrolase [Chitinophaga sancti]|uniref:malto-oligosyltrehalose trehalohydrolase n=1 Tax=Chitinophaga sancti TaxID=1004 RepID=UPI003F794AE2
MKKTGAFYKQDHSCTFCVWAPEKEQVTLHLIRPEDRSFAMTKDEEGYYSVTVENVVPGAQYYYHIDGQDLPDPASGWQPADIYGPSAVVDHEAYAWQDQQWHGIPFKDMVLYELHVGTFSPEGTFEGIIPYLDDLKDTGINALELMPVCQFPGERNWGYDGVFQYAVHHSYGGPEGLKKLVDACHQRGIAVFLDVVYNHLGGEGNSFHHFGPYFSQIYSIPWGSAINFDGTYSDGPKGYFANNVIHWLEQYHIDGLRLDAVHCIFDNSAVTLWEVIRDKVAQLTATTGRKYYLIGESDLNSPAILKNPCDGGMGLDAQWLDDFHHILYVLLDKEGQVRYADFNQLEQLAKAYKDGFVHTGEYVQFRKRRYGRSSAGISGEHFVVFNQNHDQIGNRVKGERLSVLVDQGRLKVAAAAIFLSPYVPMLFMGEEYGEDNPFFFFVSYKEEEHIKGIQEGRKKEFESFLKEGEMFPDPQSEETFIQSKLDWGKRKRGKYRELPEWHKALIQLRRSNEVLQNMCKDDLFVQLIGGKGYVLHRQSRNGMEHLLCLFNLSEEVLVYEMPGFKKEWNKIMDAGTHTEKMRVGELLQLQPVSVVIFG